MDKQATKKFRVVLTRENNSAVAEILRSKGGIEVVEMPLIKIERNVEDADFADIMEEMGTYAARQILRRIAGQPVETHSFTCQLKESTSAYERT